MHLNSEICSKFSWKFSPSISKDSCIKCQTIIFYTFIEHLGAFRNIPHSRHADFTMGCQWFQSFENVNQSSRKLPLATSNY